MSFEGTTQKLDSLISRLENELGERSVPINPDDPWATYRMKTFSVSPQLQVRSCSTCNTYKLTVPFESRCPLCDFRGPKEDQFALLSVEEMLASLPKPQPEPEKKQQQKKQGNANAKSGSSSQPASGSSGSSITPLDAWEQCKVQVSRIASIEKHPNADSLYVIQLETGEETPRQVCAGLVKFYQPEQLSGRLVCTVMNLKPTKLRKVLSSAMILAGSAGDQVRVVEPPAGAKVGDALYLEGSQPSTKTVQTLDKASWAAVVSKFQVNQNKATVEGKVVVSSQGPCTLELPDGSEIH